jgi:ribosomal protein S18 acetylase RimI-like enzyme
VPDLEVRAATADDCAQVEPLVDDALGRLRALRGGASLLSALSVPEDTSAESLASVLCRGATPGVETLVATLDGSVVGFAVSVATDDGIDLVGVHTARSLRRRRIGSELLGAVRAAAERRGARFEALALPGDQTVKSLLESAGFKARLLRMSDGR